MTMEILQAIFLGAIQGLTEFIPVSSSGHLILAEKIFNLEVGSLLFDVTLHIGTLTALLFYFWRDIVTTTKSFFRSPKEEKLAWLLIVGTIPAVVLGLFIEKYAETAFRSVALVLFNMTLISVLMLVIEKYHGKLSMEKLKNKNAFIIGCAQALALFPGVSRSGITIIAGMSQKLRRADAARFAFLLAIPVTLGAIIHQLATADLATIQGQYGVMLAGVISAAVTGYIAIKFLLNFLANNTLAVFAYYRLGLAAVILVITLITN